MLAALRKLFASKDVRSALLLIAAFLLLLHGCVLVLAFSYASVNPAMLSLILLAYGLGLRHAVDPDHIAAIDNTTRKLMQEGQKPVATGFFFAMGHSSIIIALSLGIAFAASFFARHMPAVRDIGSLIGTSISCLFLLLIGAINLVVLIDTFKQWRRFITGKLTEADKTTPDALAGGLLSRILRPVMRMVSHSYSMFFVGLLFGLGFDTASEVSLLSMSATAGANGMPLWLALLIPLSFTAGMSLIDTLDGVLMVGAYGWAFLQPARKLYYNMTITFTSVVIALLIGGVEALQILGKRGGFTGGIWDWSSSVQLENWGFYIIGFFMLAWIASVLIYKWRGYDQPAR